MARKLRSRPKQKKASSKKRSKLTKRRSNKCSKKRFDVKSALIGAGVTGLAIGIPAAYDSYKKYKSNETLKSRYNALFYLYEKVAGMYNYKTRGII